MTLRQWLKGAMASYLDGFIGALPVGGTVGGALGAQAGVFHADMGRRHIAIELLHILAVPVAAGLADFRTWTQDNPLTALADIPKPPTP